MELDGLARLRRGVGTKTVFVLLAVLSFLALAAVASPPARADLIDTVLDPVEDVVESVITDPSAEDDGTDTPPVEVGDVVPIVEEVVDVVDVVPPIVEEVVDVVDVVPPVVEEVVGVVPPIVDEVGEVIEIIPPVEEIVEDVLPVVEIVEDVLPVEDVVPQVIPSVLDDVVQVVPPQVMDAVEVLPIWVPAAVDTPAPIATTAAPGGAPLADTPVSLATELTKSDLQQSDVLFAKQLVAEIAHFQLAGSAMNSAGADSSPSPVADPETASLAGYVPITRTLPAPERGAGAQGPIGSSHSGSGLFGGVDAFGFFAALAALLSLCLVGWIRDRSRSGRSIFPSHGGRPG
jgi:hypothetical protein